MIEILLKEIEDVLQEILPKQIRRPNRACFYWTAATFIVCRGNNIPCVACMGSASFLFVPDDKDDGVSPTHYSYLFDPNQTDTLFLTEELPESHCWCFVEYNCKPYLVDMTTEYLPELCASMGFDWQCPEPPKRLFVPVENIPYKWMYSRDNHASAMVTLLILEKYKRRLR